MDIQKKEIPSLAYLVHRFNFVFRTKLIHGNLKKERTAELDESRRNFVKKAGLGAAALAGLSAIPVSCEQSEKNTSGYNNFFDSGDVIVFQGDSITDAGRERKNEWANEPRSLGSGYVLQIAAKLLCDLAGNSLSIYNRGISGNKVYQLNERWNKDCIDLTPRVLSILIGVNDYWHMRNGKYDGTPEIYETDLRNLLKRTKEELHGIKLIVCEPFILPNTNVVDETWIKPFRVYQEIAAHVAKEFDASWVPFQKAFTDALNYAPASYWTADGVHPTIAGSQLMADTWLKAL